VIDEEFAMPTMKRKIVLDEKDVREALAAWINDHEFPDRPVGPADIFIYMPTPIVAHVDLADKVMPPRAAAAKKTD
jgi:hypothetical protein